MESLGLVGHARLLQSVAEDFHIIRIERARVFDYLVVVGVGLKLGRLMRDDGHLGKRASLFKVHPCVRIEMIDHTSVGGIGKGERAACMGAVVAPSLTAYTAGDEEVHTGLHTLIAQIVVGAERVYLIGSHRAEVLDKLRHLGDAATQFVAQRKHAERGMMGILTHDSLALGHEKIHQHRILGIDVAPEGKFGL